MATNKKNTEVVEEKNQDAEIAALKAELEALKAKQEPAQTEAPAGTKMVKVRIPRTKKDEEDVFVSVNNYTCIIKRGVEVEVPDFVAEVLQHQEEMLEAIMLFEDAVQNKHK